MDYYGDVTPPNSPEPPLRHTRQMQQEYERQYEECLMDVYIALLKHGRDLLGSSFLQTCTLSEFSTFVFRNTQPGAKTK
jgi:hypothetical protein